MRIAHVLKEINPAFGGTVTVPLNMVRWTAAAGLDVEVWTADRFGWRPPADAGNNSITVKERPGPSGFLGKAFFERFADDLQSINVLHLHAMWNPHVARFVFACEELGVPVLHTMHGMLMDWPMSHHRPKKLLHMNLIGRRQLRRTTAVHMLNSEETRQSARPGVNFRYFELPNGVDTSEFDALPAAGTFRNAEPELADKTIILSVGRLHQIKGTDLLLEAFLDLASKREDIALVLAGPDEGLLSELQRKLQGHPAANRVRLPGLVTGDLRLALLADADIYAHCSRHETMSMAILEAAYAGKCMLVTDRCNCPEFEEVDAGVTVQVDTASIQAGLEQLLSEADQMKDRGRRAKQLVRQRFTAEVVTPKLIEHYEHLIAGRAYPWVRGSAG